ncbi:DUF935 domain-containing protein [Candidatus Magnetominusculus xianensis]|uniref:Mu-like prophage protein gp29 n=1 Tax=Candidatus Magnetominusculus xianensis TaxID=1748249 RepID=A0ABR5SDP0_9BACT|nr:DUF935 family protein [Candidatus Magnetominusculus xianensis]KWT81151.1 Mu-like prophage protein gp29 [Candidatus Magnetominusculus xianensis]MBF0402981.1 DUF935 domain-containing protein [Nitrospirota bacterium]
MAMPVSGKPLLSEIAVASVRSRYNTYPSSGLTPERLVRILREADQGNIMRLMELMEEMQEKDTQIASTLQTRSLQVAGLEWEVLPAAVSRQDKKTAAAAGEMLRYIGNLEGALLGMMDAIGKGFSVHEIMWEIAGGSVWIRELKRISQGRFTFNSKDAILSIPRLLTAAEPVWGEELVLNKFVLHRYENRAVITPRAGLLRSCAYIYLFKSYAIKDWVVFNELFSVPMRMGKYKTGATKEEIDVLKEAVFNLGVDAAAVISDSTTIELLESKLRSDTKSFSEFIAMCDKSISKLVLGHTGSSEGTPGKLGSEDEAKEVRRDILEADAKALAKTIKTYILTPWVLYNYGLDAGVPQFKFHYERQEDLEKTAKVYSALTGIGFTDIGVSHIHERFGIPAPEEDEPTLKSSTTANAKLPDTTLPANKLMLNTADEYTPEQQAIEDLRQASAANWEGQMKGLTDPITEIIDGSASLEEAKARLSGAFGSLDDAALQKTLSESMFTAAVWGRLTKWSGGAGE